MILFKWLSLFTFVLLTACVGDTPLDLENEIKVNKLSFYYPQAQYRFSIGSSVSSISPVLNDQGYFTFTVTPDLPPGLSLDSQTGAFSGIPTATSPSQDYIFKAQLGGDDALEYQYSINLEITFPAPTGLSYGNAPIIFNQLMTPKFPSVTGVVSHYTITPPLPAGLNFNTTTGVISGTPTLIPYEAPHFITAHNSGGSITTSTIIKVINQPPTNISYGSITYNCPVMTGCVINAPTVTPITALGLSFTISPSLPTGYNFNSSTGAITQAPGIPTPLPLTTYSIMASNSGGFVTTSIQIENTLSTPTSLGYPSSVTINKNYPMTSLIPNPLPVSAPISLYAFSLAPPAGLVFNSLTGEISGTPAAPAGTYTFTVTGSNASGSLSQNLTITINELPITSLVYPSFPLYLLKDQALPTPTISNPTADAPYLPNYSGSSANYFTYTRYDSSGTILTGLPAGLGWDNINGKITGTPTELAHNQIIRVVAHNGTGPSPHYDITLNITDGAPTSINYSPLFHNIIMCSTVNITASLTGGTPTFANAINQTSGQSISTDFPPIGANPGLTIQTDGTITGQVSAYFPSPQTYNVHSSNIAGATNTQVILNTLPDAPVFTIDDYQALSQHYSQHDPNITSCYQGSANTISLTPSLPSAFSLTGSQITYSPSSNIKLTPKKEHTFSITNASGSSQKNFKMELAHSLGLSRDKAWSTFGDFTRDGKDEIIIVKADCPLYSSGGDCTLGSISILKESSTAPAEYEMLLEVSISMITAASELEINHLHLMDMNGDQYPEIIYHDKHSGEIVVLKNNTGTSLSLLGSSAISPEAKDIIYTNSKIIAVTGENKIYFIDFNTSTNSLTETIHTLSGISGGVKANSLSLTHINNDNYLDLVLLDSDTNTLCPIRATSHFAFEASCLTQLSLPYNNAVEVYSAPFSSSTHHDILITFDDPPNNQSRLSVLRYTNNEFSSPSFINHGVFPTLTAQKSLLVADINQDSTLDIILRSPTSSPPRLYFLNGINLTSMTTSPHTFNQAYPVTDISIGKINGVNALMSCHDQSGSGYCHIPYSQSNPFSF